MSNESSDLIPQLATGKDCNLFTDTFVGIEIQCQFRIVLLNDDPGRLFDRLCTNTTLFVDGIVEFMFLVIILRILTIFSSRKNKTRDRRE